MATIKQEVLRHLMHLVGRKLVTARRAADLRGFHFGQVTPNESGRGDHGKIVLHIQCAWRIEGPDGIVTGRSDLWEPAESSEGLALDTWDYEQGNLQDRRIRELLGRDVPEMGSSVKDGDRFTVEGVDADDFGGAVLALSGGYRIVIFPAGSTGEDWRLFRPSSGGHFVIKGGRIEDSPDETG
jgi:hypothetical protein